MSSNSICFHVASLVPCRPCVASTVIAALGARSLHAPPSSHHVYSSPASFSDMLTMWHLEVVSPIGVSCCFGCLVSQLLTNHHVCYSPSEPPTPFLHALRDLVDVVRTASSCDATDHGLRHVLLSTGAALGSLPAGVAPDPQRPLTWLDAMLRSLFREMLPEWEADWKSSGTTASSHSRDILALCRAVLVSSLELAPDIAGSVVLEILEEHVFHQRDDAETPSQTFLSVSWLTALTALSDAFTGDVGGRDGEAGASHQGNHSVVSWLLCSDVGLDVIQRVVVDTFWQLTHHVRSLPFFSASLPTSSALSTGIPDAVRMLEVVLFLIQQLTHVEATHRLVDVASEDSYHDHEDGRDSPPQQVASFSLLRSIVAETADLVRRAFMKPSDVATNAMCVLLEISMRPPVLYAGLGAPLSLLSCDCEAECAEDAAVRSELNRVVDTLAPLLLCRRSEIVAAAANIITRLLQAANGPTARIPKSGLQRVLELSCESIETCGDVSLGPLLELMFACLTQALTVHGAWHNGDVLAPRHTMGNILKALIRDGAATSDGPVSEASDSESTLVQRVRLLTSTHRLETEALMRITPGDILVRCAAPVIEVLPLAPSAELTIIIITSFGASLRHWSADSRSLLCHAFQCAMERAANRILHADGPPVPSESGGWQSMLSATERYVFQLFGSRVTIGSALGRQLLDTVMLLYDQVCPDGIREVCSGAFHAVRIHLTQRYSSSAVTSSYGNHHRDVSLPLAAVSRAIVEAPDLVMHFIQLSEISFLRLQEQRTAAELQSVIASGVQFVCSVLLLYCRGETIGVRDGIISVVMLERSWRLMEVVSRSSTPRFSPVARLLCPRLSLFSEATSERAPVGVLKYWERFISTKYGTGAARRARSSPPAHDDSVVGFVDILLELDAASSDDAAFANPDEGFSVMAVAFLSNALEYGVVPRELCSTLALKWMSSIVCLEARLHSPALLEGECDLSLSPVTAEVVLPRTWMWMECLSQCFLPYQDGQPPSPSTMPSSLLLAQFISSTAFRMFIERGSNLGFLEKTVVQVVLSLLSMDWGSGGTFKPSLSAIADIITLGSEEDGTAASHCRQHRFDLLCEVVLLHRVPLAVNTASSSSTVSQHLNSNKSVTCDDDDDNTAKCIMALQDGSQGIVLLDHIASQTDFTSTMEPSAWGQLVNSYLIPALMLSEGSKSPFFNDFADEDRGPFFEAMCEFKTVFSEFLTKAVRRAQRGFPMRIEFADEIHLYNDERLDEALGRHYDKAFRSTVAPALLHHRLERFAFKTALQMWSTTVDEDTIVVALPRSRVVFGLAVLFQTLLDGLDGNEFAAVLAQVSPFDRSVDTWWELRDYDAINAADADADADVSRVEALVECVRLACVIRNKSSSIVKKPFNLESPWVSYVLELCARELFLSPGHVSTSHCFSKCGCRLLMWLIREYGHWTRQCGAPSLGNVPLGALTSFAFAVELLHVEQSVAENLVHVWHIAWCDMLLQDHPQIASDASAVAMFRAVQSLSSRQPPHTKQNTVLKHFITVFNKATETLRQEPNDNRDEELLLQKWLGQVP